ncbi:gentisate 1,2-dioxygenase [Rhizorhabdus wittichii DC-6]|nr:gentisate 1,2-dioxygenase [Rhizorhabdus wittichii DC-6]
MSNYKMGFEAGEAVFSDRSGSPPPENRPWAPVIITREQIDAEVERLAALDAPANGRRQSLIVHPNALPWAAGLAPGIQVTLCVLKPGERTSAFRHNATDVNFCIRGSGRALAGGREIAFGRYDTWNTPSFTTQYRINDGDDLQVCLHYSNAALLQFMQVYIAEEDAPVEQAPVETHHDDDPRRKSPFGVFDIGDGAALMPYELLINPPSVRSPALYWPWERVRAELAKLEALGQDYVGRRLYLLYNPMTGRTNGTTPNFFATITIRPPNIVDRPHRHVSAAINYYFHGTGRSSVAGNVYEWKAGDLMLSAPGWAVHNHASYGEPVYELTIQDQPLNIAMESLLWQESMKEAPALLGAQTGFQTNRAAGN